MRYYKVVVSDPKTNAILAQYTSHPNGNPDPGALNVVIDAIVVPFATPTNYASVQVWGISENDRNQASNFNNMNISVYAGFQKGLPLNNPAQAGLIFSGTIYQAFANWLGTDMTLDFVVAGGSGTSDDPAGIVLNWTAGQNLATAITNTIKTAFPSEKLTVNVSPKLTVAYDQKGSYQTMVQFAYDLKNNTQAALGGNYPGVDVVLQANGFEVFDGTTATTPIILAFTDLIGQPTYIDANTLQFVCPMRANLSINDYVMMPKNYPNAPGAVQTSAASLAQANQQSVFQGVYQITSVHHLGAFRQDDAQDWVTVFEAAYQPKGISAAAGS